MIMSDECYAFNKCGMKDKCGRDGTFCERLFKLDCLYNESLLSKKQREYIALRTDADGTDREAFKALKDKCDNIEEFVSNGKNIFIYSAITGNGKTAWAIRFIQSLFNAIWWKSDLRCRALFISVPRLLLALKDNISAKSDYVEKIKANVLDADLVVWDEIGVKGMTTFEHDNLLNFINSRVELGKSNVFTSNLAGDALRENIGDRLYSRVVNYSECFEFKGKDKRGLCK